MEKCWNLVSIVCGVLGGVLTYIFGGWDNVLIVLVSCMAIDYITGLLKGIYEKNLSSEIGFKGIIKKVMIVLMVGAACLVQKVISDKMPLRELVIVFFIANEGLSIIENAAVMLPIPETLRKVLLQLRDKGNGKELENETE